MRNLLRGREALDKRSASEKTASLIDSCHLAQLHQEGTVLVHIRDEQQRIPGGSRSFAEQEVFGITGASPV